MIITLYNTKGGCGKSSTALVLLSALAESNAKRAQAGEETLKIGAVDLDRQHSLISFGEDREARGQQGFGVTFIDLYGDDDPAKALIALEQDHDVLVVDTPGVFYEHASRVISASDAVIVPTSLDTIDAKMTAAALNFIFDLAQQEYFKGNAAALMTKMPPSATFVPKFSLAILTALRESGYPFLATAIASRPAVANIVNFSEYLFEQAERDKTSKSVASAMTDARTLLSTVLDWQVLPPMETETKPRAEETQ